MPLGIFGTFNFMIVSQAEYNILMRPFHMFGVAGVLKYASRTLHGFCVHLDTLALLRRALRFALCSAYLKSPLVLSTTRAPCKVCSSRLAGVD